MKEHKHYPLHYPGWMSKQKYYEYQKSRANAARIEHEKENQELDRHNVFVENAKKHGIPIPKKKK